jgi:hypothetical protein
MTLEIRLDGDPVQVVACNCAWNSSVASISGKGSIQFRENELVAAGLAIRQVRFDQLHGNADFVAIEKAGSVDQRAHGLAILWQDAKTQSARRSCSEASGWR